MNERELSTHRVEIIDISILTLLQMTEIIELIDNSMDNNMPVYVHCWGGAGITGTVLGCYLLVHKLPTKNNIFDMIAYLRRMIQYFYRTSLGN